MCIATIFGTTSCNDDQVFNQNDSAPLQVSVNAQGTQSSRAIIHGEYLPDGSSIGVSLFTPDGDDYDNQGYFNVKYTAAGEGESQTWAAQGTTPSISANEAFLAAYHPYNPDVETIADLIAFPVENASQTDYMYAGIVEGITNANPKVNITMQHVLTAIRVNLVLGNYTGDAAVSGIAVKSPGLASAATLNIASGELDGVSGQGDEFALTTEFDLIPVGTATDVLFVPDASVTEESTTVSATIGGKKYTAAISFDEAYLQGYIYTYTLTLNNSGFQLTKVNITPWETGNDDSAQLEPEKDNTYVVKVGIENDNTVYFHNIKSFTGTIDWGDGTTETYTETTDWPEHTYITANEYTVTTKGNIPVLCTDYYGYGIKTTYIIDILHIGKDCNIIDVNNAFDGQRITILKNGIFDGLSNITHFTHMFLGCTSLKSIPEGLFDKCTEVTNFNDAFYGCSNLQSIPEGLFDNCIKVTEFSGAFSGCSSLQSIPEGLFDKCTEVTNFYATFSGCSSLQSIPSGLFDNNNKVTSFGETFIGCTGLEGESPYTMVNGVKVHLYERNNYPDYFTAPTSYSYCFRNCSGLTDYNSIPSSWK